MISPSIVSDARGAGNSPMARKAEDRTTTPLQRPVVAGVIPVAPSLVRPHGEVVDEHTPEQALALWRHRLDQVVRQVQAVVLRSDGVVAVEDRDAVHVRVLPGG